MLNLCVATGQLELNCDWFSSPQLLLLTGIPGTPGAPAAPATPDGPWGPGGPLSREVKSSLDADITSLLSIADE